MSGCICSVVALQWFFVPEYCNDRFERGAPSSTVRLGEVAGQVEIQQVAPTNSYQTKKAICSISKSPKIGI